MIRGGNAIWIKCLEFFFRKFSYSFRCDGHSFQTLDAATEKACLPKLCFILRSISCEIDDLSCLGIFERCRRLAKGRVVVV